MSKAFFATSAVLHGLGFALALYFASEIMVGAALVVSMFSFGAWALLRKVDLLLGRHGIDDNW